MFPNINSDRSIAGYFHIVGGIDALSANEELEQCLHIVSLNEKYLHHLLTHPELKSSINITLSEWDNTELRDQYASKIMRIVANSAPRVSTKRAKELFKSIRTSDQCYHWFRTFSRFALSAEYMTTSEKHWSKELSKRYSILQHAKNKFVESNLRLVIVLAKRYRSVATSFAFSDLIQEGNIGLMKAIDKFDPTRGFKFSTYASWWIRQQIRRAISDKDHLIRVPVHMSDDIYKITHSMQVHFAKTGEFDTPEGISKETGIRLIQVKNALKARVPVSSLDAPLDANEEDGILREEVIMDEKTKSPYEVLELSNFAQCLQKSMQVLTSMESKVLTWRFGLDGTEPKTLKAIADIFFLSRERIRQIENKAIKKIRTKSIKHLQSI